ncbi:MAG: response regulator transcription factor [Phycisphaerales bacterium]|nr:MAG: response regulator transcription factor [Phycisphaerales bacterium]
MKSALIIEDNSAMLRGLKDNFESKGFRVRTARDGEQGLAAALTENPDLVILDVMLPKIDGYEICSRVRREKLDTPVIMLSARDRETDVVRGLNIGADDYVTKPFSIKELLARAQALMRRRGADDPAFYEFGDCRLDTVSETLTRGGRRIELSPGEFKMLRLFLRRAGYVLTCDEIRDAVWGYSRFVTERDIDCTVLALRSKIEPDPENPVFIHNVSATGYKFERPNGNDPDS